MDHIQQIAEAISGDSTPKVVSWTPSETDPDNPMLTQVDVKLRSDISPFTMADEIEDVMWSKDAPAYSEIHDALFYKDHIVYYGEWGRGNGYITVVGKTPIIIYKEFLDSMGPNLPVAEPADDWEDEFSEDEFDQRHFLNFFAQMRSHQR